jgi:hypothetical protein
LLTFKFKVASDSSTLAIAINLKWAEQPIIFMHYRIFRQALISKKSVGLAQKHGKPIEKRMPLPQNTNNN